MGKRYFLWLIFWIIFLAFSGNGGKAAVSDKTETLQVMNAYMDVLKSNKVFYLYTNFTNGHSEDAKELGYQGQDTLLKNLLKDYLDSEGPWQIKQFTIIDLDRDGVPEVIAELSKDGEKIVFHYENGKVYGFSFSSRGLQSLKKDGTFISTGGADYIYFQKLQFSNGVCKNKVLAYTDTIADGGKDRLIFYINDKQVSEDMFLPLFKEHEQKEDVKWHLYSESTVDTDFAAAWNNTAAKVDNTETEIGVMLAYENKVLARKRVIIDAADFKELTPGCEYMLDALLYVKLQSFEPLLRETYNEDTILSRVRELEGNGIRAITATQSEKDSARLTYPVWRIAYQKGTNEDTRLCTDLYFQTDSGEYRVHTSVAADYAQEYKDVIERILAGVSLAETDEQCLQCGDEND